MCTLVGFGVMLRALFFGLGGVREPLRLGDLELLRGDLLLFLLPLGDLLLLVGGDLVVLLLLGDLLGWFSLSLCLGEDDAFLWLFKSAALGDLEVSLFFERFTLEPLRELPEEEELDSEPEELLELPLELFESPEELKQYIQVFQIMRLQL